MVRRTWAVHLVSTLRVSLSSTATTVEAALAARPRAFAPAPTALAICGWRSRASGSAASTQVRKRHFLRHLYIKCIILPRQARDKHRENYKKSAVFPQCVTACTRRDHGKALRYFSSGAIKCLSGAIIFIIIYIIFIIYLMIYHYSHALTIVKNERFTKTGSGST
jgi:hypothetical protein